MWLKKSNKIGVLGISSAYIGAIIGAGYASGQEILQFFNAFGEYGKLSIAISTVLFVIFAFCPLILAYRMRCMDFEELITPTKTKFPKVFSDILVSVTQFGTLVIMVSAAGSMFNMMYDIPYWSGSLVVSILLVIVLFSGLDGIVRVLSAMVPVMIVVAFIIGIYGSVNSIPADESKELVVNSSPLLKHWILSGILYVSYNFSIAFGIAVPMGFRAKNEKTIAIASVLSGVVIGVCAYVLYLAMHNNIYAVGSLDLPMVAIAENIDPRLKFIYSGILFIGLYSTAISCYYGFYSRAYKLKIFYKFGEKTLAIVIMALSLILSQIGFSKLISFIYPALGYGSILIMIFLIITMYVKLPRKNKAEK